MKTKESNSGNRKQNAKNALLKITTITVCFVVISFIGFTQDDWKYFLTNDDFEMMAMLESNLTNTESVSFNESRSLFYIEPAIEDALELETWMTDGFLFNVYSYILKEKVENKLELKDWMTNESYFTIPYEVETEEELKLENWMMNEKIWM